MGKKLANIVLAAVFGILIFAWLIGIVIASAEITTYNEPGKYIEGTNVSVNTLDAFNRSWINIPLTFQVNNTLNATAANFSVTNQTGLTVNKTSLNATEWFQVNATTADVYWVNVSNSENQSEYVYFTVEYSVPPPSPPQEITIRIEPETLNLASKGVFTAFITGVTDINVSTVECEGAHAVKGTIAGDTFIAKFNRQDLVNVTAGDAVELTVTGELSDGTPFKGTDTIRVIGKRKGVSPGMLPDHSFYKVKRWSERVHVFFTFNDTAKARLHTHFSEVRLAEAKAMIQLGKPEWAGGLMEDYMEELNGTYMCMQRQSQKGQPVMDLAEYMCNATDEQAEILADLIDEVPEKEKPYMERAINASSRGHIRALEAIKEEKPKRAAQLSAEFAEKRMIRAMEMFEVGRHEQAQRMLRRYNESMEEAEKAMKVAEKRGLNVTEIAEHVGNMTYKHIEILEDLSDKVPEHAKPHIERAINVSIQGHETSVNRTQRGKWQLDVTERQERFNETPANITQKGLQRTAEKYNKTEMGRKVKETGNPEKKKGPK
ncbi:MAG TPA: hypothetical protein EYP28_00700 [Methanophagales archaeon]|nr:hypothetical protein [Methanophagales archaeon]